MYDLRAMSCTLCCFLIQQPKKEDEYEEIRRIMIRRREEGKTQKKEKEKEKGKEKEEENDKSTTQLQKL